MQARLNQFGLLVSSLPEFNNVLLANLPSITPLVQSAPEASSQLDTSQIVESLAKIEPVKTKTIQFTTNLLELLPQIRQQLDKLPPSRTTVYAQINFAQNLTKLKEVASSAIEVDKQLKILVEEINKNSIEENSSEDSAEATPEDNNFEAPAEATPATLPPDNRA